MRNRCADHVLVVRFRIVRKTLPYFIDGMNAELTCEWIQHRLPALSIGQLAKCRTVQQDHGVTASSSEIPCMNASSIDKFCVFHVILHPPRGYSRRQRTDDFSISIKDFMQLYISGV